MGPAPDAAGGDAARYRQIFDGALDGFVMIDVHGIITEWNPQAEQIFGIPRAEAVRRRLGDLIVPARHLDAHREWAERGELSEQPFFNQRLETEAVHRAGHEIAVELRIIPVHLESGDAFSVFVRDISPSRGAESALRESQARVHAQLAQADRLASMGLLAASVAHEVNNPITYVLLNLERLAVELPGASATLRHLRGELAASLGEEQAAALFDRTGATRTLNAMDSFVERVQTATEGARQVGRIARDLRSFARVEGDERSLVDLPALLDRVIEIAANELRFRATVVREYGDTPPVLANEGRLSQVLLNLLINAAHAIDEGAPERNTVRLRTSAGPDGVQITVSDSGSGIAHEHLPRLFDPFFTTKPASQGSGLGLSICRDIVLALGGRIDVASTPGAGSHFTVHLPAGVAREPHTLAPPSPRPSLQARTRRPRVLVIDDERILRATLAALLESHYDVELADSGAAAFTLLAANPRYDAILCDVMMPDISGMQVKAWLESHAPRLLPRTVFMTGGAFTRNAGEFLERGSNRYIEKPFEVTALIELLDKVIGSGAVNNPSL